MAIFAGQSANSSFPEACSDRQLTKPWQRQNIPGGWGTNMTNVLTDILKEPAQLLVSLSYALTTGSKELERAASLLRSAKTVIIAGIGASWHAGMAMQSVFLAQGRQTLLMDASELLYFAELTAGTVVVLLSRSGRSIEIVRLLKKCRADSVSTIAITNSPDSTLARAADVVLCTNTDFDHGVSITTYTAINLNATLLALWACDYPVTILADELRTSIEQSAAAIPQWRETIEMSGWTDTNAANYFLARGSSLSSCHEARLLWEEAAKMPATALTTGGFRHGPQEMVHEGLRIGMWIDAERMRQQDLSLAADLRSLGARVFLIGQALDAGAASCVVSLPPIPSAFQSIIDVIPIQIAAEQLAALRGQDCDTFRLCSYIVQDEGGLGNSKLATENAGA